MFRIYIAMLFIGARANPLVYLAAFLVIYATYTLDRVVGCDEDTINRPELRSARKGFALFLCVFAQIGGFLILGMQNLASVALFPFFMGCVYGNEIPLGQNRLTLKGGLGAKNLVVAFTWGVFITAIAHHWTESTLALVAVFSFFSLKSFVNTVIYDFRDMRGDAFGGLRTLPIYLGERATRRMLQAVHLLLHLIVGYALLANAIVFEPLILLPSLVIGLMYTSFYARPAEEREPRYRKLMRDVLVDGEFILEVSFRELYLFYLL